MKKDIMIELFDELVLSTGKADTVAGELIRATALVKTIAKLRYRLFDDDSKILAGNGTCNSCLRYITSKLGDLADSEDLNVVGSENLKDEFNRLWELNSLWDGDSMLDDEYEEQL